MLDTYTVQLVVSMSGLALSAVMLLSGSDPAIYVPVAASIIGYWLPAPRRAAVAADTSTAAGRLLPQPAAESQGSVTSDARITNLPRTP